MLTESSPTGIRAVRREWPLVLAVLLGAVLRLDQIGVQIPLDDEWHALHAVERFTALHVATHFGWTDYSIPLTLYDKAVAASVGLSEAWMRLPVLAAGLASLAVMPLIVRPWIGRDAAALFGWLLALSPVHVYFSRYARPYSIALLLTFVAVFALGNARILNRPLFAWAYAVCAILAPYFHLTTLPLVLLPLALAWAARITRKDTAGPLAAGPLLRRVTVTVAFGLALLVGPPLVIDRAALLYKAGRGTVTLGTLAAAARLVAGSAKEWVAVAMAAAAVAGAATLARRHPQRAAYLLLIALAALALPCLTHPLLAELPIVVVRYALILVPVVLILAACAGDALIRRLTARMPGARHLAGPALAGALIVLGPLPRTYARPNEWTNHPAFQYSYSTNPCDAGPPVPAFYQWLGRLPRARERIVEAPWLFAAAANRFECYQRVHGQDMLIGFVGGVYEAVGRSGLPRPGELPILSQPRKYRFRSFVHLGAEDDLRRRGVHFVVLHKSIEREMGGAADAGGLGIEPWIDRYRQRFGPPVYEDDVLVVFDVATRARA